MNHKQIHKCEKQKQSTFLGRYGGEECLALEDSSMKESEG